MSEKRILLVDDSRLSLQLFSALLQAERPQLNVDTCNSSMDALSIICREAYDLVVLDLNMPQISGDELAERLRAEENDTRLCFLTANVQKPVKNRLEDRFGPVFNKPVNQEVAHAVLALLDAGQ